MAHKAYFYNSKSGDRKYNAESFMEWLLPFFTSGVFNGCFQVTANNNMTVTVSGGYANVGGRVCVYDSAEIFDLAKASGNMARIDNVVLRRDDTNRDIYLTIQTGAFSNNPTPPDLMRDNAIYDLKLAEIRIGVGVIVVTQANITDTRMKPDVCGWVMSTVKEIDFTQITAQFDRFFSEYKPMIEADYDQYAADITAFYELYKAHTVDRYGEYVDYVESHEQQTDDRYGQYLQFVGNHEAQIDVRYLEFVSILSTYKTNSAAAYAALLAWMEAYKVDGTAEFEAWVDTIKDILDAETAGNLLLMIQELQSGVPAAVIGTIAHGLECYPVARLYKVDYAAGVGGAGDGGAGGGSLITTPAVYELDGFDAITIKATPEFALHTEVHKITDKTYSFTRAGIDTSLYLILEGAKSCCTKH